MRSPAQIIRKMANPEGMAIPQHYLADICIAKLRREKVFQYGDTLFTVEKVGSTGGVVHLYSIGGNLLLSTKKFMRDVWKRTDYAYLLAPIKQEGVMKLAFRFGWKDTGKAETSGHRIFMIRRP